MRLASVNQKTVQKRLVHTLFSLLSNVWNCYKCPPLNVCELALNVSDTQAIYCLKWMDILASIFNNNKSVFMFHVHEKRKSSHLGIRRDKMWGRSNSHKRPVLRLFGSFFLKFHQKANIIGYMHACISLIDSYSPIREVFSHTCEVQQIKSTEQGSRKPIDKQDINEHFIRNCLPLLYLEAVCLSFQLQFISVEWGRKYLSVK